MAMATGMQPQLQIQQSWAATSPFPTLKYFFFFWKTFAENLNQMIQFPSRENVLIPDTWFEMATLSGPPCYLVWTFFCPLLSLFQRLKGWNMTWRCGSAPSV